MGLLADLGGGELGMRHMQTKIALFHAVCWKIWQTCTLVAPWSWAPALVNHVSAPGDVRKIWDVNDVALLPLVFVDLYTWGRVWVHHLSFGRKPPPIAVSVVAFFFSSAQLHTSTNNEKLGPLLPERKSVVASGETQVMNSNSTSAVLETLVFFLFFCGHLYTCIQ